MILWNKTFKKVFRLLFLDVRKKFDVSPGDIFGIVKFNGLEDHI